MIIGIKMNFEKKDYFWHNKKWTTGNNLTINTSLAQKLNEYAVKNGFLSKQDFLTIQQPQQQDKVDITKKE